jgi:MFS family permease
MIAKEQAAVSAGQAVASKRSTTWWPLVVLVAINVLNFYDRQVAGAIVEPVRKEFHLTDTAIGLLNTLSLILYGLVGLPLGLLADRISRKKLLAAGIVVWTVFTASARWINSYSFLLISRLGVGVGEATAAPTATSWIGDLFPAERRSKPLALFMLGVPVGGALSFFFTGPIALKFGWRAAMVVAAAPALLWVPLLLMLREPARGAAEKHAPAADAGSIWAVLRVPTFWWITLSGALVNFILYSIGLFFPAFFARIHHMNVARAGVMTGIVYAIGGVLGGSVAGIWGDRIVHRNRSGRMKIAAIAALLAVPLAYFGIHVSPEWQIVLPIAIGKHQLIIPMALPPLTIAYGLLNMYYGLVYASIQDIVAPALRGTSMSIYFLVMYLGGASWGTLIIGKMSDRFALHAAQLAGLDKITEPFKAIGLQQALLAIPVLSALLALVLWAGSGTIGKDMEKQQRAA